MKILIDIPKEFEVDYNTDRFADFFHRCIADMGTCCLDEILKECDADGNT